MAFNTPSNNYLKCPPSSGCKTCYPNGSYVEGGSYQTITSTVPKAYYIPSDKEYRDTVYNIPLPKEPEPLKESWCKCGARHLPNDLPKEFLGGLVDFKEQWLEHSNLLERSEIDKLKKSHDKACFDRYISDTYAGYNDSALCYD